MTELWPTAKVELFSEALCLLHPARCRFTQSIGISAEGAPPSQNTPVNPPFHPLVLREHCGSPGASAPAPRVRPLASRTPYYLTMQLIQTPGDMLIWGRGSGIIVFLNLNSR